MLYALLFGCLGKITDSGGSSVPCYERSPELTIGTGEFHWKNLADGDSLTMVHGPQGGWHMLGSMRLGNTLQIIEVDFTITDLESGSEISSNHYRVAMIMEEECDGYYPGMYGYLNVSDLSQGDLDTPPELLGGHEMLLKMSANDCTLSQNDAGQCVRADRWVDSTLSVIAELDAMDIE
jgi:hypothetical protein